MSDSKPQLASRTNQGVIGAVVLGIAYQFFGDQLTVDQVDAVEALIVAALGWAGIGLRGALGGVGGWLGK